MLTQVRSTSIEVYNSLQSKFGAQACKIMSFMHEHPHKDFTRREIASYLHLDTSSVSGRANKLVADGDLIELENKRKCTITGVTAIALCLPQG